MRQDSPIGTETVLAAPSSVWHRNRHTPGGVANHREDACARRRSARLASVSPLSPRRARWTICERPSPSAARVMLAGGCERRHANAGELSARNGVTREAIYQRFEAQGFARCLSELRGRAVIVIANEKADG